MKEDQITADVENVGMKRNACKVSVGKIEGKGSFRRPRHRWYDTIKINIEDIKWKIMDQIHLSQDWDQ
jgi:hypothetical protein